MSTNRPRRRVQPSCSCHRDRGAGGEGETGVPVHLRGVAGGDGGGALPGRGRDGRGGGDIQLRQRCACNGASTGCRPRPNFSLQPLSAHGLAPCASTPDHCTRNAAYTLRCPLPLPRWHLHLLARALRLAAVRGRGRRRVPLPRAQTSCRRQSRRSGWRRPCSRSCLTQLWRTGRTPKHEGTRQWLLSMY